MKRKRPERKRLHLDGQKAAKNDDDVVPIQLWDRTILRNYFSHLNYSNVVSEALAIIRNKIAFRWYLLCVRRSLFWYLRKCYGIEWWKDLKSNLPKKRKRNQDSTLSDSQLKQDLAVARDAIYRVSNSTWWEWRAGSTCFFWRWPKQIRNEIRDGTPVYVEGKLPNFRQRQVFRLEDNEFDLLKKKVAKVIDRGYIESGYVRSLISYFA